MKKNTLAIILVLVLGISLFTAATVAASSTDVGYETFKETMELVQHENIGAGKLNFTITDNGQVVLNGQVDAVGNEADETFSGQVTLTSEDAEALLSFYGVDETVYVIDEANDGYFKIADDGMYDDEDYDYDHYDNDHKMTQVEEELLDYFVGDLKDNFVVVENTDGSKDLSFSMKDSEVPTVLNLLAKAGSAAEHRNGDFDKDEYEEDMPFMKDFDHEELTDLTEDVQIDEVSFNLSVDPNYNVTSIDFKAVVSGKDVDGQYHQIAIAFSGDLDYSNTEVEAIDIDAYDWETIEHTEEKGRHRR